VYRIPYLRLEVQTDLQLQRPQILAIVIQYLNLALEPTRIGQQTHQRHFRIPKSYVVPLIHIKLALRLILHMSHPKQRFLMLDKVVSHFEHSSTCLEVLEGLGVHFEVELPIVVEHGVESFKEDSG